MQGNEQNNNNNDDDEDDNVIPARYRIQDLDGWLQSNGLRGPEDDVPRGDWAQSEEESRLAEHRAYERAIHDAVFKDEAETKKQQQDDIRKTLQCVKWSTIEFRTAGDVLTPAVPLIHFVSCDAIVAKANSWGKFSNNETMEFSLENFTQSSVQEFVDVLLDETKSASDISSANLIDCCLIAHYLCNESMLSEITDIMIASIDTSNCLSLCQLADELNLHLLFERSLAHMMDTIGDLENNEAFEDFTPELRNRIVAIKSAIESSIHSQHRLYFSSLDEYISIFAERVQYYKERLCEAKEQQLMATKGTLSWIDAQSKIVRQERRVHTLEIALSEQKKLFRSSRSCVDLVSSF